MPLQIAKENTCEKCLSMWTDHWSSLKCNLPFNPFASLNTKLTNYYSPRKYSKTTHNTEHRTSISPIHMQYDHRNSPRQSPVAWRADRRGWPPPNRSKTNPSDNAPLSCRDVKRPHHCHLYTSSWSWLGCLLWKWRPLKIFKVKLRRNNKVTCSYQLDRWSRWDLYFHHLASWSWTVAR